MESQGTWGSQDNLKKKEVRGLMFPNVKTRNITKTIVIETVWWYWHNDRHIDQ